jgi:hypothetical protein
MQHSHQHQEGDDEQYEAGTKKSVGAVGSKHRV